MLMQGRLKNPGRWTNGLAPLAALIAAASFLASPALAARSAPQDASQKKLTDTEITETVERELLFEPAIPSHRIDVSTVDGIVTLEGDARDILAKERAAAVARTVRGVRSVVNDISVMENKRSDSEVRGDVLAALLSNPATDSYEIDVSVNGGTVTLGGDVESWTEKGLAAKVAKGVNGVRAVQNDIELEYDGDRSDVEIKADVEQALHWDRFIDDAMIKTAVDDGVVTLTGTVGSAAERNRAHSKAWVGGVKSVDSDGIDVEFWARDEKLRTSAYTGKSDKKIRAAVLDALLYDARVLSTNVDPSVSGGIVTLKGTVDNLQAKRAAAEDARNTLGVWRVKNRLKVRPTAPRTDEKIEASIASAFARDPYVDRYEVDVDVIDSTAFLYGDVDSYFEKARAENLASDVQNVTMVRNYLTVADPSPLVYDPYVHDWYPYDYDWYPSTHETAFKTDWEIREDIKDELWWSPFVDADQVNVAVDDGVATLTGAVDSWAEREAARENAFEGGAISVKNRLAVNGAETAGD